MNKRILRLTLSSFFITLGLVLPLVTMQIPTLGNLLLPMHLPILLCGMICGPLYGLMAGAITPLLRGVIFGVPPFLPVALPMAFELATYGLVAGFSYNKVAKNTFGRYLSLITAMIVGRIVWGIAAYFTYQLMGNVFTWQMFLAGAIINAIPGIILQLILVPLLMDRVRPSWYGLKTK